MDVALPGVAAIVNTFWPKKNDGTPKDSATKMEVTTATGRAKSAATMQAKTALKPLNDLTKELEMVATFIDAVLPATQRAASIRARISSGTPNPVLWNDLNTDWTALKQSINKLGPTRPADVAAAVHDLSLARDMEGILNLPTTTFPDIDGTFMLAKQAGQEAAALNRLDRQIDAVTNQLNLIIYIAGIEIVGLRVAVATVADWGAPAPAPNSNLERNLRTALAHEAITSTSRSRANLR